MYTFRPDSAGKALGYGAVGLGLTVGVIQATTAVWLHYFPPKEQSHSPQRSRAALTVPAAPPSYHDVAYYIAHPAEMRIRIAWCDNNPGIAMSNVDCQSASDAAWKVSWAKQSRQ